VTTTLEKSHFWVVVAETILCPKLIRIIIYDPKIPGQASMFEILCKQRFRKRPLQKFYGITVLRVTFLDPNILNTKFQKQGILKIKLRGLKRSGSKIVSNVQKSGSSLE
jgi:hypothetical protein